MADIAASRPGKEKEGDCPTGTQTHDPAFAVGIDLGTTNTSLSFLPIGADDEAQDAKPETFAIPQVIRPGEVGARKLLPSFIYCAHETERGNGELALPWNSRAKVAVGEWARSKGALTPARLISSAKSWLCHPTLDRRSAFLPVGAPDDLSKISPLAASAVYLAHLKSAWNSSVARGDPSKRLENQAITLTVPASFDAVARNLTVEAAKMAGLNEVTLLEEPQAALYAWVMAMGDKWRKEISPGDVILVCDVGGGTTDFSLIQAGEEDGNLTLRRLAVGDHILLGGDNMDLALAMSLSQGLSQNGTKLDRWQLIALTYAVRGAKERLLSDDSQTALDITIPSRSSRLVGGALKVTLTRELIDRLLLQGFFPDVSIAEPLPPLPRRLGLTSMGLPYASDPAVTRHLARFLMRHADAASGTPQSSSDFRIAHPTAVLFNGGVMKAENLRRRVLDILSRWMAQDGGRPPRELPGAELDLAVSQGASAFSRVRATGKGIRIRGGTARAYYVGVETSMPAVPGLPPPIKALCLAPMGMEEGTEAELPGADLGAVVGEAVQFQLFASSVRRSDAVGDEVEDVSELDALPVLESTLTPEGEEKAGEVIPVRLKARVSEVGTLELFCQATRSQSRWKLEFDLRGSGEAAPPEDSADAP